MIPSSRTLKLRVDFPIGSMVYLKADDEPRRGMVTGILLRPTGPVLLVTWAGGDERHHFACELDDVPDAEAEADDDQADTDTEES